MKPAAEVINSKVLEIMELWEEEVTKEVPASINLSEIALYDHLPNLMKDISTVMSRRKTLIDAQTDDKYQEILENSIEHGRHRASSSNYTASQIVHEYIVFHKTLTATLLKNEVYTLEVGELLKYLIETAILNSVESFSKALSEMQDKLIGTLAHDIRNPLSAAKTSLDLMEYDEGEEWFDTMKGTASKSVTKALSLIEGLMDSISVKAGQGMMMNFTEENITQVVKDVYTDAIDIYSHSFECKGDLHDITGVFDKIAIRRLLENLISNAVKYGSYKTPIILKLIDLKESVKISVRNYGSPIPKDRQGEIFQFLRKDQSQNNINLNSWGMGLTLVRLVAEAHGGYVHLESDTTEGTCFTILLDKNFNKPGKTRTKLKER
ncbi:HAMP domain-containing histidine kinase [Aquimarina sp. U1-2]|uniref:sensor histidine kinase n=1 Tax=Aquimarina sp. U1-2 TaxID=2823141 RepID=UPI001AEC7AF5|nr:HAMP domain-containing sensor histidine kinase [Aquimarina sp. U1-2]MBP2833685.1 HAMP domain-containing histidine kinase [Aquimarina sp. U1-2]